MAKAYSYLRFSRPSQMKGDSQRRQVERSEAWAARKGLPLDETLNLRDLGVSAFRGKNVQQGALSHFLEAIETKRVKPGDYLILENLDRLSRDEVFTKALPLVQRIINSGVSIVTLDPERVYSRETVREIGPLLEMLLAMYLANEESRKKSERLSAAWSTKRKKALDKKLTRICPRWLRLAADRMTFELISDRVEIIRRVFRLSADGAGATVIVKTLNAEDVPPFGRGRGKKDVAKFWQVSSVKKILANRAVLGEYQPHRMKDGKRVSVGSPLANYFPAIIEEADFYAAEKSRARRQGRGGRNGYRVTNLFTGLMKDARDGTSLTIVDKGDGPTLVSTAARVGHKRAVYMSFPYEPFEQSVLVWGYDLNLADVLPRKATNLEAEVGKVEGRLAELESRIAKLKDWLKTAGDIDAILEAVGELDQERTETRAKLERLKAEQATPEKEVVDGLKNLIRQVNRAKGDTLYTLRLKLRQLLARLIADIVVLVVRVNRDRIAISDVQLRNGTHRQFTISPPGRRVALPKELVGCDVRQWRKWPVRLRKVQFAVETEETRTMVELDDSGFNRSDIAKRLGTSLTRVSRTLIDCGRRRQAKKPANSERLMTWHPAGRGWVKRYKGRRYFVGLGTLERTYPELLKARTCDGSWKAANAWWQAQIGTQQP